MGSLVPLVKSPSLMANTSELNLDEAGRFYYNIIKRGFSDFFVSDKTLYRFIIDFQKHDYVHRSIVANIGKIPFGMEMSAIIVKNVDEIEKIPLLGKEIKHAEQHVIRQFLLGSDFFWNSPRKKEIKYIGLYDPYTRPCRNPFANLHT